MKMKIDFLTKNHILHKFFIYLLAIFATCLTLCYSISTKVKPTRKEMYNVFVGADLINDNLRDYINKTIGSYVKEIHTYAFNPNTSTYSTAYEAYGLSYTDILILPEDKVTDYDTYYFVPLTSEFYSSDDYIVEDKGVSYHYGKLLFDSMIGLLTDSIYYEDKNYYLFINQKSEHLLPFQEDSSTNLTYTLLKDILNGERK